jgi:GNAT superfamily N-acetyltransferase
MLPDQHEVDLFIQAYAHLQAAVARAELRSLDGLAWLHFNDVVDASLSDEFIAVGLPPGEVCQRIAAAQPGLRHWLTLLTTDSQPAHQTCLAHGYTFQEGEFLMTRPLGEARALRAGPGDERVRRAARAGLLERINQARGYRVFTPEQLVDPGLEIAAVEQEGQVVAWGAGLLADAETLYITNMYTRPEQRRQGLASAILSHLHAWGRGKGAQRSLLVSSQMGRGLYLNLGYHERLRCLVFRKDS